MMNDWYQRMVDTLQLNGKGEAPSRPTSARCACFLSSTRKPRVEPVRSVRDEPPGPDKNAYDAGSLLQHGGASAS